MAYDNCSYFRPPTGEGEGEGIKWVGDFGVVENAILSFSLVVLCSRHYYKSSKHVMKKMLDSRHCCAE